MSHASTTHAASAPPRTTSSVIARLATAFVWTLWLASGTVFAAAWYGHEWGLLGWLRVDGLAAVLWMAITFVSGIVHSYARRYLVGDHRRYRFFAYGVAFTLLALLMAAADHVALFAAAWLGMGLVMARLIGYDRDWTAARAAGRLAGRYFLASTACIVIGFGILGWWTGESSIAGMLTAAPAVPSAVQFVAVGFLLAGAIVQSAVAPAHRWLATAMTAPTPASALMHAGFVNAGAVLLARFAPVVTAEPVLMAAIVLIGGASAILGQAMLQVQPDRKGALASSTTAQMGFMLLQCGLGLFTAAIAHLVLHGCYKTYRFLGVGGAVDRTVPHADARGRSRPLVFATAAATAIAGTIAFLVITGKGFGGPPDTGLVLAIVVGLAAFHAVRDLGDRTSRHPILGVVLAPVAIVAAIGLYAAVFGAVTAVMADVPGAYAPQELGIVHGVVLVAFVLAYVAADRGLLGRDPRIYVRLVNAGRPWHPAADGVRGVIR